MSLVVMYIILFELIFIFFVGVILLYNRITMGRWFWNKQHIKCTGKVSKAVSTFSLVFDEAPTLVYVQKSKVGIGELYLNGKRLYGLQKIELEAETSAETSFPELRLTVVPSALAEFGQ